MGAHEKNISKQIELDHLKNTKILNKIDSKESFKRRPINLFSTYTMEFIIQI